MALTLSLTSLVGTGLGIGLAFLGNESPSRPWLINTGWALATASYVVGPSAGHLYAGEASHAAGFSALRLGLGGAGLALMADGLVEHMDCEEYGSDGSGCGGLEIAAGITLFATSTALVFYDIVDAPRAARRAPGRAPAVALLPAVLADGRGGRTPGLALALTR